MAEHGLVFPIALLVFQVLLIGLFGGYVRYDSETPFRKKDGNRLVDKDVDYPKDAKSFYTSFQDVHVMIFIGFGFLMVFLKKYGFGAVSYNMLLSCICIQWATLLNAWIKQRILYEEHPQDRKYNPDTGEVFSPSQIKVGYLDLMTADFTAAAVLITYGALLGKTSRFQLLLVVILECIFFAINENILIDFIAIRDTGGSVVVHLFGAYFGLGVALVIQNSGGDEHELDSSTYHSDLFAMIGTIFLWVFWPSFNSGTLGDHPDLQRVAIINTYFALAACVAGAFATSTLVQKNYKLDIVQIQNATLAGGVAVGTCADLPLQPWGAALIGFLGGILSVLGFAFVSPFLVKRLKIHDTCGVHNLHGMPAVFSGICSAIAAASIDSNLLSGLYGKVPYSRSLSTQAGFQVAGVCVSFAIAIVGGIITGLLIKPFNKDVEYLYADEAEWLVPDDYIHLHTTVKSGEAENGITNEVVEMENSTA